MLRGEGPQASCNNGHSTEPGPGRIDHIGATRVLLAVPVISIPALQVVFSAGYGHLHAFFWAP